MLTGFLTYSHLHTCFTPLVFGAMLFVEVFLMAQGDKSAYTDKQQRQAKHIEEGYEQRGMPEEQSERIAWSTVNKQDGGGKKSGSGQVKSSGTTKKASTKSKGKRAKKSN